MVALANRRPQFGRIVRRWHAVGCEPHGGCPRGPKLAMQAAAGTPEVATGKLKWLEVDRQWVVGGFSL